MTKLYNKKTYEISNHLFKNPWKSKFKIPEIEKEEVRRVKKLWSWKKLKHKTLQRGSQVSWILKNEIKTNNFSSLITSYKRRIEFFCQWPKLISLTSSRILMKIVKKFVKHFNCLISQVNFFLLWILSFFNSEKEKNSGKQFDAFDAFVTAVLYQSLKLFCNSKSFMK